MGLDQEGKSVRLVKLLYVDRLLCHLCLHEHHASAVCKLIQDQSQLPSVRRALLCFALLCAMPALVKLVWCVSA